MAIFFDMDPSLAHGQVQLYAAPGFESAYLDNSERQAIFEDDMLPYLRDADFDAALLAALHKVDAAATPEHAAQLQTARQVNAVMGLIGAPAAVLGLGGLGVRALAALRQGPRLSRRSLDPHARPAAGPDRRVRARWWSMARARAAR